MSINRCKICEKLGRKEHERQEVRLMKAASKWADGIGKGITNWRALERAAMAYGRKRVKP